MRFSVSNFHVVFGWLEDSGWQEYVVEKNYHFMFLDYEMFVNIGAKSIFKKKRKFISFISIMQCAVALFAT